MLHSDLGSKEITAVLSSEGPFPANVSTLELNWLLPSGKELIFLTFDQIAWYPLELISGCQ